MILLINYSHKWWYKALSVLLVVALILAMSFGAAPRAHAVGVLTITVCAAILAVMAGAGIATVVSGMTSADIQNWMTGKLNEWDTYRNDGNVFSDLIQNNLITTTVKGALAIGNGAARGISDFITWLKNDLLLNDNDYTVVNSTGLLSNYYTITQRSLGTYYQNGNTFFVQSVQWNDRICGFIFDSINTIQSLEIDFVGSVNKVDYPCLFQNSNSYITLTNAVNCYLQNNNSIFASNSGQVSGHLVFNNPSQITNYCSNGASITLTVSGITINNQTIDVSSLGLDTDVINIPSVADDGQTDIVIGIDGVYPGATAEEAADVILDGVLDNNLDTTMTVTDEYVDAVEAVVINEQPISVNTDHHMIGFTGLPNFENLNLRSIWHYITDAIDYASDFITWFMNLLTTIPTLAIPLYMSFTLLVVLSFIRRILM